MDREIFQTLLTYIEEELGAIARQYFFGVGNHNTQKYDGSVVTEVDKLIEQKLRSFIKHNFPEDSIFGEEEGLIRGSSNFTWVIDPIDGTDNFVRKIPFFAITIARIGNSPEGTGAIIYNPVSRQTFSSFAGEPLRENGHVITRNEESIGGRSYVTVTGSNSSTPWIKMARQNIQKALYKEFGKSGHYHSSLLEHAYVAAGRLEGLLQIEMSAWDSAAGVYLVQAAGGNVSVLRDGAWALHTGTIRDLYGEDFSHKPTLFVSSPAIHTRALELVGNPQDWSSE